LLTNGGRALQSISGGQGCAAGGQHANKVGAASTVAFLFACIWRE
jgi:hypothetical protein